MVKIATTWLCCCSGCHISMLDLHERLLDLLGDAELVHCPVLMDVKEIPEDVDVVLIEGGIRNEENVEVAEEFRERAEIVVAVGACACYGGVPGLANLYSNEELLRTVYVETASTENEDGVIPSEGVPELTWRVHPLSDVIDVDHELPGCPPEPDLIADAITAILDGRESELPTTNLCEECPRKKEETVIHEIRRPVEGEPDPDRCLLEQGYPCMGPATRAGCGARCPEAGVPCAGCAGPTGGVPDQGAEMMSAIASIFRADVDDVDPSELVESVPDVVGWFYRFTLAGSLVPFKVDRE
ncbi:NADH-quinone oxidoreductase subunit B family protein [Methanopyrus sp.]